MIGAHRELGDVGEIAAGHLEAARLDQRHPMLRSAGVTQFIPTATCRFIDFRCSNLAAP